MKRHVSPFQVMTSLSLFSAFSFMYLSVIISFGEGKAEGWSIAAIAVSGICIAFQVLFAVFTLRKTKRVRADEFTSENLNKSGYIAFILLSSMITFMFIVLNIMVFLNKNASDLTDFLNVKIIAAAFAFIQIAASMVFSLVYLLLTKRGEKIK